MTTIAQVTPSIVCEKHHITPEQLSQGTHIILNGTQHCVIVESASVPGQTYKVIFNSEYQCLQCTVHNGQACKASASGRACYHKRVALALLELERVEARREQEEKPTTPTIKAICEKHNISQEMFSKATHISTWGTTDGAKHYYLVEDLSSTEEHKVEWDPSLKLVYCSCKVHFNCWHTRASLAAEEHFKAEQLARSQQEQAEVEQTQEYAFEQAMQAFEQAMDEFDHYTAEFNQMMSEAGILA